jgi:hypothetical protein
MARQKMMISNNPIAVSFGVRRNSRLERTFILGAASLVWTCTYTPPMACKFPHPSSLQVSSVRLATVTRFLFFYPATLKTMSNSQSKTRRPLGLHDLQANPPLDPVATANNISQKLFGNTARLEYNENVNVTRPVESRYAVLARSTSPHSFFLPT